MSSESIILYDDKSLPGYSSCTISSFNYTFSILKKFLLLIVCSNYLIDSSGKLNATPSLKRNDVSKSKNYN